MQNLKKKLTIASGEEFAEKKYKEINKDFFLLKLPKEKKYAHYKAGKNDMVTKKK